MEAHVVLGNAGKCDTMLLTPTIYVMNGTLLPRLALTLDTRYSPYCLIMTPFEGLRVESYGTGTQVRLPGRTAMEPRIFKFGTPYADMYTSLAATAEDAAYFTRNGVLQLCRRGAAVKTAPARWQDTPDELVSLHDVVIAFEERVFDAVIEDLQIRQPTQDFRPIHVVCLDTKDNPHEAALQGQVALDLCWRLEQAEDLQVEAAEIIDQFQQERAAYTPIKVLYQLCFL
jgi:RNA polymerase II subunit A C-terminal domain phosphatase SSU72